MPSGHHIPNHKLRDIAAGYLDLHMTPELILQTFFGEEQVSHRPSLRWITRLCRRLTHESRLSFSTGPFKKLGRKRSQLLPFEATCLLDLFSATNCRCLRKLHGDFKRTHFVNPDSICPKLWDDRKVFPQPSLLVKSDGTWTHLARWGWNHGV